MAVTANWYVLPPDTYTVWARITATPEIPVVVVGTLQIT